MIGSSIHSRFVTLESLGLLWLLAVVAGYWAGYWARYLASRLDREASRFGVQAVRFQCTLTGVMSAVLVAVWFYYVFLHGAV